MILRSAGSGAAAAALLGGCASTYGPQSLGSGATINETLAKMGSPTARYAREGGERVEFARGPYGKHTYMLDFDAQGRLAHWDQVLTEQNFNTVREGETREQVLLAIGHPSDIRALPVQGRTLWSYRYDAVFCKWFQVGLDASNKVVDTGYGPDPLCDQHHSFGTR